MWSSENMPFCFISNFWWQILFNSFLHLLVFYYWSGNPACVDTKPKRQISFVVVVCAGRCPFLSLPQPDVFPLPLWWGTKITSTFPEWLERQWIMCEWCVRILLKIVFFCLCMTVRWTLQNDGQECCVSGPSCCSYVMLNMIFDTTMIFYYWFIWLYPSSFQL